MFAWGEECSRGFWLKESSGTDSRTAEEEDGVQYLNLSHQVAGVCVGHRVLVYIKTNGNAFIIRTNERTDGRRVRGKQKFVKCKERIEAVSCGDDVVALLSERGTVFCVDTTRAPFTPRPPEAFSNIPVCQVACGDQHSVALSKDGQVYTWGQDSRGQLGLGKPTSGSGSPQHLRSLSGIPVVRVSAGGQQSFALSVSGGVFGWGRNDCGQLGLGDTEDRHTPASVRSLNMKKICHVSCGKDHTAALTKDGVVFTFGSGRSGQLGHNSLRDELRPRLVAELWGAKVIQVACGRHHTVVLTDVGRVYSFGCGEQGQLGRGGEARPSVPLPVQLPPGTKIRNIFAGENCSFATCSSDEDDHRDSNSESVVTGQCLDGMIERWTSECDSKSWKKMKQEIFRMFSSASCLNRSFLEQSRDKHFQTSAKYHGVNLSAARQAFRKLVKKEDVRTEIEAAVLHMLPLLDKRPVGVEQLRIYLLLNELLHAIQKRSRQQSTKLAEAVATAVVGLSVEHLQVIGSWWSSLSLSTMVRHVNVWKNALSVILSYECVPRNAGVRNLLLVLQYLYNFGKVEPLVLCSFPIVMDLQTKKMVFDMNADVTKLIAAERVGREMFLDLYYCVPHPEDFTFLLDLRRESILDDTFEQLAAAQPGDYERPLTVYFDENFTMDNVFSKDFFYEVFHEMVSAETGMFMFNDSETLAWFSSRAAQDDPRFSLFGVLCGLALYNQCIIYLPFPLVLFKKLLGLKPTLEDMKEFSPSVGNCLQCTLYEYSDDDFENLYMEFLINWDATDVELDPENPGKPVTSQNKKQFVDAYLNHAFTASVETPFQEFRRGFFQVCDRDLVKLFRPKELQELLVGKDFNDWEKLKQNTEYLGGYHVDHPNIQMFWEVFQELTENQKKAFLWFVTGFERVPILSMDKMKMTVNAKQVRDLNCDQFYPEAHTCFSQLDLPMYSTKEIMRDKLTEALCNNKRISQ